MSNIDDGLQKIKDTETLDRMNASRQMVLAFTDLIEGKHLVEPGGWFDFYTYEPLQYGVDQLKPIFSALSQLVDPAEMDWEIRIFGCDGLLTFRPDGSLIDA